MFGATHKTICFLVLLAYFQPLIAVAQPSPDTIQRLEKAQAQKSREVKEKTKALEESQLAQSKQTQERGKVLEGEESGDRQKMRQNEILLEEQDRKERDEAAKHKEAVESKQAELGGQILTRANRVEREGSQASAQVRARAASLEQLQQTEREKTLWRANSLLPRAPVRAPAPYPGPQVPAPAAPLKIQPEGAKIEPGVMLSPKWAKPAPPGKLGKPLIFGIRLHGNTLLNQQEVDKMTSAFLGKELNLDNLTRLSNVVTEHYHKKGYTLARAYVPPQDVQDGLPGIFVVEGRVGKIVIEGNRSYRESLIRYFLSPGIENGVIQPEKIQRALFLLNDLPNLHAQAFLRPGKATGTSDIYITVVDKTPIHETIDFDNFGNKAVGKSRAGLTVSHGNITGRADRFDARMVAPFPSRENPFFQGGYSLVLDPLGTRLGLSYSNADILLGQSLQALDIRGSAILYAISLTRPFVRSESQQSNLSLSFYYKNSNSFVFTNTLNSDDRLRELEGEYNHRWSTTAGAHAMDVTVTQGLGTWFGGMGKQDPFVSRAGADDTFTKLSAGYSFTRRIFGDNLLILRGSGQYASIPLPVTEQYSIGGPDSVHGYLQSEFLGDSGWTLNAEYRYPLTQSNSDDTAYLGFFLDFGYSTLKNPGLGETSKRHLSGYGFGFRSSVFPATIFRVDLGFPLDPSSNQSNERPVLYTQFSTQL